jgi:Gram-negative porin
MHRSPMSAAASIALTLALCPTLAGAALPEIDISGFGTGGVAVTDTGKAEFGRLQQQPVGANNEGDVGIDSLFALQGTVHLTDMFSATVQGMARRLFSAGFQLDIPVFFVKAQVTRDVAVRAGRIELPVFMNSDYREVGYSNTWIRPPIEVYGQVPLDSDDGVDFLYRKTIGPADISAQAFYGKTDVAFSGVAIQSRKNWGVNANVTVGPLTLRAGRNQSAFTATSATITQVLTGVNAAGFTTLANQLNPQNVPFKFTDLGFRFDETHFTIQGEVTKATAGGFVSSTDGQYLLLGYRVEKFTPYAMYSRQKVTSERTNKTIPRFGALIPLALGVDQLINSIGADQHTFSAGVRWDVRESVDLKLQVDRVSLQGNGLFINVQPGFHGPVTVAGLTLDFVF